MKGEKPLQPLRNDGLPRSSVDRLFANDAKVKHSDAGIDWLQGATEAGAQDACLSDSLNWCGLAKPGIRPSDRASWSTRPPGSVQTQSQTQ